jgi:hypothetical protein
MEPSDGRRVFLPAARRIRGEYAGGLADGIRRCDRLKPRIEKLDESAAKVYLKRLRTCRDLFVFMLESSSP